VVEHSTPSHGGQDAEERDVERGQGKIQPAVTPQELPPPARPTPCLSAAPVPP
jgi:hypothetical protein